MGIFDSMLSEFDSDLNAASIAEKLGIPADRVEQAIAALGIAHSQPGDTIETAAASSGLSQQHISQVVEQLGGDSALGKLSGMLGKGKSNPVTDKLSDIFGG